MRTINRLAHVECPGRQYASRQYCDQGSVVTIIGLHLRLEHCLVLVGALIPQCCCQCVSINRARLDNSWLIHISIGLYLFVSINKLLEQLFGLAPAKHN